MAPVLLVAVVLAGLAGWNARSKTAEVLISLERPAPRSMQLLLLDPRGEHAAQGTFDPGGEQLRLDLPDGFYETYLDGRYTGVGILIPDQSRTVLLIPPERGQLQEIQPAATPAPPIQQGSEPNSPRDD